jgi:hypothetical protein
MRECRFLVDGNHLYSYAAHCSSHQLVTDRAYIRTHKGNAVLRPIDKPPSNLKAKRQNGIKFSNEKGKSNRLNLRTWASLI